jgi:hypothetical protein
VLAREAVEELNGALEELEAILAAMSLVYGPRTFRKSFSGMTSISFLGAM